MKDGQQVHDSGPLTVQMRRGQATLPPYKGFPTGELGACESFIRVTGQSPPVESATVGYTVVPGGPDEIVINLPGLPQSATPLALAKIPGGSFMMGSVNDEPGRYDMESPRHHVQIGFSFYMGRYEVTRAQWEAVMGTTPWQGSYAPPEDPNGPAVYVSWNQIREASGFLDNLNALHSGTFRLPSEAEWEYACRAGTTTRFYWGDDLDESRIGDYAWYTVNAWEVGEKYAHGVGLKLPNAFGLYDMSGNVAEWCEDWRHTSYTGAPDDGSAWLIGGDQFQRNKVVRSGGFTSPPRICRSACRGDYGPQGQGSSLGFRVVWTP